MKRIVKGAVVTGIILIVLIGINVICNINGHELDAVSTGTVAAVGAMVIYQGTIRNEKE